jgi:hypothetical protein
MTCAGVDVASRSIKVLVFDAEQPRVLSCGIVDQGVAQQRLAAELFERVLERAKAYRRRGLRSGRVRARQFALSRGF